MMLRALMLSAVLVAPAAFAQAPVVAPSKPGFFRPALDPSLTHAPAMTPEQQAALEAAQAQALQPQVVPPMQPMTPAAAATLRPETALTPVPNQPVAATQFVEQQMDRSLRENEAARVRTMTAPQGVNGAFDGTTSERNR